MKTYQKQSIRTQGGSEMKKKMISILLAGAMAAGMLAGCGDSGEKTGDGNGQQAAEEAGAEEADPGASIYAIPNIILFESHHQPRHWHVIVDEQI